MKNNLTKITNEGHLENMKGLIKKHPELYDVFADEMTILTTPSLSLGYIGLAALIGVTVKYGPQLFDAVRDYVAK